MVENLRRAGIRKVTKVAGPFTAAIAQSGAGGGATAEAKPKPAAGFEIDPAQVQDLADRIADLQTAGAGYALRFRLAAVLDDDTPAEVRAAVDRLLDESLTDRPPDP